MSREPSIDQLICDIHALDREDCKKQLRRLQALTLDFSDEFLNTQSLDRLRHILLAACLQSRKKSRGLGA